MTDSSFLWIIGILLVFCIVDKIYDIKERKKK